jgi:hypothetical protein
VSDIDIAVPDSLKLLDLKRPIREADIGDRGGHVGFGPIGDIDRATIASGIQAASSREY